MAPVHRTPCGAVGVMLIERVIATVEVAQSVRVVDPPCSSSNVEGGVPAVVACALKLARGFFSAFQRLLVCEGERCVGQGMLLVCQGMRIPSVQVIFLFGDLRAFIGRLDIVRIRRRTHQVSASCDAPVMGAKRYPSCPHHCKQHRWRASRRCLPAFT